MYYLDLYFLLIFYHTMVGKRALGHIIVVVFVYCSKQESILRGKTSINQVQQNSRLNKRCALCQQYFFKPKHHILYFHSEVFQLYNNGNIFKLFSSVTFVHNMQYNVILCVGACTSLSQIYVPANIQTELNQLLSAGLTGLRFKRTKDYFTELMVRVVHRCDSQKSIKREEDILFCIFIDCF